MDEVVVMPSVVFPNVSSLLDIVDPVGNLKILSYPAGIVRVSNLLVECLPFWRGKNVEVPLYPVCNWRHQADIALLDISSSSSRWLLSRSARVRRRCAAEPSGCDGDVPNRLSVVYFLKFLRFLVVFVLVPVIKSEIMILSRSVKKKDLHTLKVNSWMWVLIGDLI